jgi:hypothetical protein
VNSAVDLDAINRAALANARLIVQRFLPGGKFRSLEYIAKNPRRNDKNSGSFKVNYRTGQWADFATNDKGGDLISWVAYVKDISPANAARELSDVLGFDPLHRNGGNGVQPAVQSIDDKPRGRIAATYDYTDATGTLLYQVVRYEPKEFRQRRPDGNGGFIWRLDERRVIYRWPELLKYPDATIFICEGEKDADRVASLEHCTTTVAAGKWTAECVKALAGRDCLILRDNDDAGREKALAAARALHGTAASVRIVLLPNLPDKGDVSDWLDADPRRAEKLVDVCFDVPEWAPFISTASDLGAGNSWKYHLGASPAHPRWLIKGMLPETGAALMAGQWGTYKTTVALTASVCVMADLPFAGHYRIKRRGAVILFALEGEGMIDARLSAVANHLGVSGPLPFAWRGDCPHLTDGDAIEKLCAMIDAAAADLKRKFGLPAVLIWIDTMIAASGHEKGDDSDAAASQKLMNTLKQVSRHTGALVVGIDHFGKVVETGTRGSSAKEGAADTVIALLADREVSGGVKNTRLALRKQRDGISGIEIPFTARIVETGVDDDADPVTATVIDWEATQQAPRGDARWTKSMQLLRRILGTTLVDCGQNVRPFPDGPSVRACDVEAARAEFYRQYPADGTEKQKADARRQAFNRSINAAQARGLVASREVEGVQLIWLATTEVANA